MRLSLPLVFDSTAPFVRSLCIATTCLTADCHPAAFLSLSGAAGAYVGVYAGAFVGADEGSEEPFELL